MLRSIVNLRKGLARFGKARDGAAALEMALVSIPFFLLLFGLGEVAMIGFAQANLNYAIAEVARDIRTGQTQTAEMTQSQVKQRLCTKINTLMSLGCTDLYLDVKKFDSFVNAANPNPVQNGQFSDSGFGFNPGDPSEIVVVRTFYRWHLITPLFENLLANTGGGDRILASTQMFRNEPFPDPTP